MAFFGCLFNAFLFGKGYSIVYYHELAALVGFHQMKNLGEFVISVLEA